MTSNDEYALEVLIEAGYVTPEQVDLARASIDEGDTITVVDALVRDRIVSDLDVYRALAAKFGMDTVNLLEQEIPGEVIEEVPAEVARRYRVIPVYKDEGTLTVAIGDPLDMDTLDSLRYILKCDVEGVVTRPEEIRVALERYYAREVTLESVFEHVQDGGADVQLSGQHDMAEDVAITDEDTPIIRLVSLIILEAHRLRASDIHLEPLEKRFRVRYRIDGVLHEVDSPPKRLQSPIISRVKLMAGMKLSERRIPQDGRIQVTARGRQLDLRVSTVPANHGESVVMRILDKQNLLLGLPQLGFFSDDQRTFEGLIQLSDGILLVTGPTGSGKTTTLYACLNHINRPDRKIITVEDPVEYHLSGINQVHVREDIGLTFASALRSILRQAPNIVMIGEIRDLETAEIAMHASLTGHLVFSTLHTNDAPSAVTRLLDLGVQPFLVASSVRAIMAQRLVRSICPDCKEPTDVSAESLATLGLDAGQFEDVTFYHGRGCNRCQLTGYFSRVGIFEIFMVQDETQRLIFDRMPAERLRAHGRAMGMRTLREDGLRKVVAGLTTFEEVARVTMGDSG